MNIYLEECRAYRKFTLIWTVSLVSLLILYFSMYGTIVKDAETAKTFIKLLESYPEEMKRMMGIQVETITSVLGYYSFSLAFILLFAAMQGMIIGVSIVSKETRERTADFLLTKPVTRTKVIVSKMLAAVSSILFTNVVFYIFAYLTIEIAKTEEFNRGNFLMMSFVILFIQIIFFALGIFLSVILPKIKSVLPLSLGVVFAFFALATLSSGDNYDPKRYLTPFRYFNTNTIMLRGSYEISYLVVSIVFVLIAIISSVYIFNKKDIHAV